MDYLRLKNPRSAIIEASIQYLPFNDTDKFSRPYLLSYTNKYHRQETQIFKTISAAKGWFSKYCIQPEYHGKNEWEKQNDQ